MHCGVWVNIQSARTTGICFAVMGAVVACFDTDAAKIESLRQGRVPIFETGRESLVVSNVREGIFDDCNPYYPKRVHATPFENFGIGR